MEKTMAEAKAGADARTGRKAAGKQRRTATFTQPVRQIVMMLISLGLVAAGAWLIHHQVERILATNIWLNGVIVFVFLLGLATCFWQVLILVQSISWIEGFVRQDDTREGRQAPRLLAPLAALLRSRSGQPQLQISSSSSRSILESVAQRIDEARDITRYLTNLLVFLGLLGTFFGLATSVPAIVDTIRSLAPAEGESGMALFGKLMDGLEAQLGGMGTAFSTSLLGLAGSLVVGLLELFASHGQNRFYRELEEWLSSITLIGYAGDEGGDGEGAAMVAALEQMSQQIGLQMAEQVEATRAIVAQAAASRVEEGRHLRELTAAVAALTRHLQAEAGQAETLRRIADGQEGLVAAMTGPDSAAQNDAESRMRLRSIDVQLLRILEEIAAGRQESVADVRAELSALTAAVRQLSRTGVGR